MRSGWRKLTSLMILLPVLLAAALSLRVSWSEVDISPPEPLRLGGYSERGSKVLQTGGEKLYARYIHLAQGKTDVLFISLEMLTIPESLRDGVLANLPKGTALFMAATHTHCAPDSQMLNSRMTFAVPGIAPYSRTWSKWYVDKISEGAMKNLAMPMTETSLGMSSASVFLNHNRRSGPQPDPTVTRLLIPNHVLLTHYTAHATIFDANRLQTSGDWPGEVARRSGGLVLVGPIGDVSPQALGVTPAEKIQDFATRVESALKHPASPLASASLTAFETKIEVPIPRPHPTFAQEYGVAPSLAQVVVDKFAPRDGYLSVVRLGDVIIVGVPGEPSTEVGAKIQAIFLAHGFPHTLVCSHVNGWVGYILTPGDYDKGGYEATLAFHGREFATKIWAAAEASALQLKYRGRL